MSSRQKSKPGSTSGGSKSAKVSSSSSPEKTEKPPKPTEKESAKVGTKVFINESHKGGAKKPTKQTTSTSASRTKLQDEKKGKSGAKAEGEGRTKPGGKDSGLVTRPAKKPTTRDDGSDQSSAQPSETPGSRSESRSEEQGRQAAKLSQRPKQPQSRSNQTFAQISEPSTSRSQSEQGVKTKKDSRAKKLQLRNPKTAAQLCDPCSGYGSGSDAAPLSEAERMHKRKGVTALRFQRGLKGGYLEDPVQVFSASASGAGEPPFGEEVGILSAMGARGAGTGKGRAVDPPDDGRGGGGRDDSGKEPPPDGTGTLANSKHHEDQCILYNFPVEVREGVFEHLLDHRVVQYDPQSPDTRAGPSGVRVFEGVVLPLLPGRARPPPFSHTFWGSRAPGYDLSFELLNITNKATRAAAAAHFEERNQLIQIDYNMPFFSQYIHEADIPIVTDSSSAGSKPKYRREGHKILTTLECVQPAVHLKIRWSMNHYLPEEDGEPNVRDGVQRDEGWFLIMVTGFDKLCFLFKHLCQYANPRGIYIVSDRDETRADLRVVDNPDPDVQDPDNPPLPNLPALTLRFTRPKMLQRKVANPEGGAKITRAEWLMQHLRTITGGGHGLTVTSIDSELTKKYISAEYLQYLKRAMAPSLIWLHSLRLAQYEISTILRARIHKNVSQLNLPNHALGDFARKHWSLFQHCEEQRQEMYDRLVGNNAPHNEEFTNWSHAAFPNTWANTAEAIVLLLLTGTFLDHAALDRAVGIWSDLSRLYNFTSFYTTPRMKLQLGHLHLLLYMADHLDVPMRHILPHLEEDAQEMRDVEPSEFYEQARHDLEIVEPVLDQLNTNPHIQGPLVRTIYFQMSIKTTGFWSFGPVEEPGTPVEKREHWQDEEATATLDSESKNAIRQLQHAHHFVMSTI